MAKILIIDDEPVFNLFLSEVAQELGHSTESAFTIQEGLQIAEAEEFEIVFLDVNLPDGNGLEILPRIRSLKSSPDVIILTAMGSEDGAEVAIKNGAWSYLQKPISLEDVTLSLNQVLQYRKSINKAQQSIKVLKVDHIVGISPAMKACFDLLAQAAMSEANVLINGETGTGKEVFARAIHDNSSRADNSFVVVDCASLPEKLVESILFGHEKGSFTGAEKATKGLVKQADGGTLFLDEIGELPLEMQKSFLRVLQEHRFRPVGSENEIKSSFRLIAATNRNLEHQCTGGNFREDLLYRVRAIVIELPPLRGRQEDIKELIIDYTNKICENNHIATKGFSPDFLKTLFQYSWPGNVRELIHTLERAIVNAHNEPVLFPTHLPTHVRIAVAKATLVEQKTDTTESNPTPSSNQTYEYPDFRTYRENALSEIEKKYLQELMAQTKGSIKDSCRISGLGRSRLYNLLKKHDISRYGWDIGLP